MRAYPPTSADPAAARSIPPARRARLAVAPVPLAGRPRDRIQVPIPGRTPAPIRAPAHILDRARTRGLDLDQPPIPGPGRDRVRTLALRRPHRLSLIHI